MLILVITNIVFVLKSSVTKSSVSGKTRYILKSIRILITKVMKKEDRKKVMMKGQNVLMEPVVTGNGSLNSFYRLFNSLNRF